MEEAVVRERLRQWRVAHPQATFDQIEAEVEREYAAVQAQVVAELSGQPAADASPAPVCPPCQIRLPARGPRKRRLVTRHGRDLTLERIYYVCPACGAGRFPPR